MDEKTRTWTLKVDERELMLVGRALAEMPYKVSAPLLHKIERQVTDQAKAPDAAPAPEPWKK